MSQDGLLVFQPSEQDSLRRYRILQKKDYQPLLMISKLAIVTSARAFSEIISNIKTYERARTANKLNVYGHPLKSYKVGDKVTFYLPPNDKEAKRMGKNPKHMLQYQGPGTIVESLSNNDTSFKIK